MQNNSNTYRNLPTISQPDVPNYYPVGTLEIPPLKALKEGAWEIREVDQKFLYGYYTAFHERPQAQGPNWALIKNGQTWMSVTPLELESLKLQAENAFGHTVIAGLGIGLVLYNVALNSKVEKITVLESDPEIIDLFKSIQAISSETWEPLREKFSIQHVDAFEWRPEKTDTVDYLAIDIWPCTGTNGICKKRSRITEVRMMNANIRPTKLDFWCQEDCVARFVERRHGPAKEINEDDIAAFAGAHNVPLGSRDNPEFSGLCRYRKHQREIESREPVKDRFTELIILVRPDGTPTMERTPMTSHEVVMNDIEEEEDSEIKLEEMSHPPGTTTMGDR